MAALYKGAAITQTFEITKDIADGSASEMPALAFENQEGQVLSKDTFRTFKHANLGAFYIYLKNRDPFIRAEVIV